MFCRSLLTDISTSNRSKQYLRYVNGKFVLKADSHKARGAAPRCWKTGFGAPKWRPALHPYVYNYHSLLNVMLSPSPRSWTGLDFFKRIRRYRYVCSLLSGSLPWLNCLFPLSLCPRGLPQEILSTRRPRKCPLWNSACREKRFTCWQHMNARWLRYS